MLGILARVKHRFARDGGLGQTVSWLHGALLILSLAMVLLPPGLDAGDRVTIYKGLDLLAYAQLIVFLTLILSIISLASKWWHSVLWILALCVPNGICWCVYLFAEQTNLHAYASLDVGQTRYRILSLSFLQGSEIAIGKLESSSLFFDEYTKVATSAIEGSIQLVRPRSVPDDISGLRLFGAKVCAVDGDRLFAVYDQATGEGTTFDSIQNVSPFILVGRNDDLNPEDVKAFPGYGLSQDALKVELKNPNSRVRDLVQGLLHE